MDFNNVFDEYSSYIYNYALKLCCDPSVAEDIAQETFLIAWKNKGQLRNKDSIKYWLRTICLNIFRMKLRKEKGKIELSYDELTDLEREGNTLQISTDDASPEDEVVVDEAVKDLQNGCFMAMVRRLTPNQRMTFSLIDMFGLSMDEVAELLDISKSATKSLLYRARMNLDDFFSKHCDIIDVDNPCSCKAWIEFSKHRSNMQNKVHNHKLIEELDYKANGYEYKDDVRRKVRYLYSNMPDRKPDVDWYNRVIEALTEIG